MGLCSSACFPFHGKVPAGPAVILDLPGRGTGATFIVHRESLRAGNPWAPRDVQWTVTNAEGDNWLFLTSNTNFEQCEYTSSPWCIVRHYHRNLPGGGGEATSGSTNFYDVLLVKLRLNFSRGLAYASFHRKNSPGDRHWSSHHIASASWFVTSEAIERMGTQVAVQFRGEFRGETNLSVAAVDWQLRRVDDQTLVLNHVNEPAVMIQMLSSLTVSSSSPAQAPRSTGGEPGETSLTKASISTTMNANAATPSGRAQRRR